MQCPVDLTRLNLRQSGTVQYAGCPSCNGVWFGPRHLATLDLPENLRARSLKALAAGRGLGDSMSRRCADCGKTLRAATIENVNVDLCPECGGAWLGESVFKDVLAWYQQR